MSYDPEAFNAFEAAGWARRPRAPTTDYWRRSPRRSPSRCSMRPVWSRGRVSSTWPPDPAYVAGAAARAEPGSSGSTARDAMLEFARRAVLRASSSAATSRVVPFPDESFDAVTAAVRASASRRVPSGRAQRLARVLGRAAPGSVHGLGRAASSRDWHGIALRRDRGGGRSACRRVPAGPPFFRFADEHELTALIDRRGLRRRRRRSGRVSRSRPASADALWDGLDRRRRSSCAHVVALRARRRQRSDSRSVRPWTRRRRAGTVRVSVKLGSGRKP